MLEKRLLIIILVMLFVLSRIPGLGSGLNLLEPDEWDYQNIAQSFAAGWPPTWKGVPYLEKFPVYVFLGFLVDRLFNFTQWAGPYVNLRLISVVANGTIAWLLFDFLKKQVSGRIAFVGTGLYLLTPVILFYSRVGTLESLASLAAVGFWTHFANRKQMKPVILLAVSGVLLALAILVKQVNLIVLGAPIGLLAGYWGEGKLPKRWWQPIMVPVVIGGIIIALITGGMNWMQSGVQARQLVSLGERFLVTSPRQIVAQEIVYAQKSVDWLGWPTLIWLAGGIVLGVWRRRQQKEVWLAGGVILAWVALLGLYGRVTPRNLFAGVPFLFLLAGTGFARLAPRWRKPLLIGSLALIIGLFPQSWLAFESGRHLGVEQLSLKAAQLKRENPALPLFATFDQEKLTELVGYPVFLLADEATDGGILLTDERKTELMLNLSEADYQEAREVLRFVKDGHDPVFIYQDPYPHFPGSRKGNTLKIYLIRN
jgi:4-amino-4-deoxy-L-arabinose transferase-like glycosyltransferase